MFGDERSFAVIKVPNGGKEDAQGNIIALIDNSGKVVVEYVYDAWGNHAVLDANGNDLTNASHIGNRNPFRYRGYFYDVETGLYYLQTRYYDPEIGRFLNMDDISYADPEQFHGLNLYAYCGNDPVNRIDPNGTFWGMILIGALIGGLVNGISALASGATLGQAALSFLSGGIMGAAMGAATAFGGLFAIGSMGFGTALAGSAIIGAGGNLASYMIDSATYGREMTVGEGLVAVVSGVSQGAISCFIGLFAGNGGAYSKFLKKGTAEYASGMAKGFYGKGAFTPMFTALTQKIHYLLPEFVENMLTITQSSMLSNMVTNGLMVGIPRMAFRKLIGWMFGED